MGIVGMVVRSKAEIHKVRYALYYVQLYLSEPLVVPQRLHRVGLRGSTSGDINCSDTHEGEQCCCTPQRDAVNRRDTPCGAPFRIGLFMPQGN